MSMCSLLLCCWKRVFAMTGSFSWQSSISLYPASFCTPRPNLPVTPGISWLPTFAFSHVWLCATLWMVSPQLSLSMGILQARTLEWVALPFSRDSCWPRYWTGASCVADGFYTDWVTRNVLWQFCQIVIHFCFILLVTESSLLNHNNFLKAYICIICSHQIKLFN